MSENAILLGFGVAIGVAGAFGVVAIYELIDFAFGVFYRWPATFIFRTAFLAYRPLITAAGFVTAWWIMRRLGRAPGTRRPRHATRGGPARRKCRPCRRSPDAASAITIGSGGSAGSEGPVASGRRGRSLLADFGSRETG